MELIKLLVQKLPKFGGWPEGAVECARFVDEANIGFYDKYGNWPEDCAEKYGARFAEKCVKQKWPTTGPSTEIVTRQEYEAALAALNSPAWNGEGLPPVGCVCEFQNFSNSPWQQVRVIHYFGDEVWLEPLNGAQSFVLGNPDGFRPLRTEAERRREASTQAMNIAWRARAGEEDDGVLKSIYEIIYDAIAAGKVPDIRLTDDAGAKENIPD